MNQPRLIEINCSLPAMSEGSLQDKNIRLEHVSSFHTWWAEQRTAPLPRIGKQFSPSPLPPRQPAS